MKKGIVFITLVLSLFLLTACKKPTLYTFNFYEYMDTFISINVYTTDASKADTMKQDIKEIYRTYHELSNNYFALSENSGFKENIYSVNQKINQDIEIDEELYLMLEEAERIKDLTDGYFDISIGKMVDAWKEVIFDEDNNYMHNEVPTSVFQSVLTKLEDISLVEEPYLLTTSSGQYFVKLTHEDVKLDLGALSKGYATQLVYEYILEQGIKFFSISAGSSSISIGKNYNRNTHMFHVSLASPVQTGQTYGMLYVQNKAINTSGNFEQYFLYEGLRYHHVVSPMTKMPAQYYHTVTLIGDDAGLLDALTTALISMNEEKFEQFLEQHQQSLNLEVVRFNYDETITSHLIDTVFEEF